MNISQNMDLNFQNGLQKLGFDLNDNSLFLVNEKEKISVSEIAFHLEKALDFKASAVYLKKQLNGSFKPQAYLFDFTDRPFNKENEIELTEIQKKIWSSGEAPLACIFYNSEIKILNCTTHINDDYTPVHLIKDLKLTGEAHYLYNEQFAIKIKSGIFWEEEILKNKFKFQNSSYDILIENIHYIISNLKHQFVDISVNLINKIIVQSILIKYLEERIDNNGNKLLSQKYFRKFDKASTFNDVLKKGKFVELLSDLNNPDTGFNGNVFTWTNEEQNNLKKLNLSLLADLLDTKKLHLRSPQSELEFPNWRYFEFKYIPVELISRLYEEFLGEDKKDKGLFYTPSHLAKLLIDECLPLKKYENFDLDTYTILDPACGSGIFLVLAFKRLVQIWRLKNEMRLPELSDLKKILRNIYGIDKEEQAIRLASFSACLALCNELEPIEIIHKLKFDDLRETNFIQSDFFTEHKLINQRFDLIIGNPPFSRGAIKSYSEFWEFEEEKVKIPQGQIALKFLSESLSYLKESGLLCLIIKSSGLLYNSSSEQYKRLLFSRFNIIQILDFSALARNKSLWDNGADVASAAIFLRNEKPDFNNNILHLTFRRTNATKERIIFEIDDYDLHFIQRDTAIEDKFIWKINLLGGGRIRNVVEKSKALNSFNDYLVKNNCITGEGFIIGTSGTLNPGFIYKIPSLPTDAISENGIDYSQLNKIDEKIKFVKVPSEIIFKGPNVIIWENIGETKLPVFYNERSFSYKHKIIGIASVVGDKNILKSIVESFEKNFDFYRFYIFVTSSQILINLNTAILKNDLMQLPFVDLSSPAIFSRFDKNIISDVNNYMQDFIRHGERSKALMPIPDIELAYFLTSYGNEFSKALNIIYRENKKRFRLSDVVILPNSLVATIFKYDSKTKEPLIHFNSESNIEAFSNNEISKQLTVNRIIRLYPDKETIIFIKPNQYRYWLSIIAYRDADKYFSDLSKLNSL